MRVPISRPQLLVSVRTGARLRYRFACGMESWVQLRNDVYSGGGDIRRARSRVCWRLTTQPTNTCTATLRDNRIRVCQLISPAPFLLSFLFTLVLCTWCVNLIYFVFTFTLCQLKTTWVRFCARTCWKLWRLWCSWLPRRPSCKQNWLFINTKWNIVCIFTSHCASNTNDSRRIALFTDGIACTYESKCDVFETVLLG